jgi:hypothetical protein
VMVSKCAGIATASREDTPSQSSLQCQHPFACPHPLAYCDNGVYDNCSNSAIVSSSSRAFNGVNFRKCN